MGKNKSQNKSYALTMIAAFLANALSIVLFLERIFATRFLEMYKDMGSEASYVISTFTAFQYISIIGFLSSLIWIIFVFIGEKRNIYILKTRVSALLIGLFILLIIISVPIVLNLLYAPMFGVIDMIK